MGAATGRHRLLKRFRNYTVEEAARLLNVHRNTVRQWIKRGLAIIDDRRPTLILGSDLAEFLQTRRTSNKRPCGPGQIYCLRCRVPVRPAGDMLDYKPDTATLGCLIGMCPRCDSLIYRRASLASLERARGDLKVTIMKGSLHIVESPSSLVNSALEQALSAHEHAQRS